ncbi:hypothetical protein SAMN04487868_1161 [Marinobacter salarius]|uniref:Replication protein n=1 Tax=Marinobacter salarius TaxID=1420917 RepID=A0ABY1FRV7_9GAMM|nr:hypothetical protein SAMN04487868_1161 [Marinobacter salarius]
MSDQSTSLREDRFSPIPRYWLGKERCSPWALAKVTRTDPLTVSLGVPLPMGLSKTPTAGQVIAALKIYIALVAMADDKKQERNVGKHCLRTTYEEIQLYLKLSRAMVCEGLKLLEAADAIERLGYKPLVYRIKGLDPKKPEEWKGHVKLPKGHLFGMRRYSSDLPIMLADYPSRGKAAMNGLVIYLLLLSVCQRDTNVSLISYDQIQKRAGLFSKDVRQAIDILVNHDLISVLRVTDETTLEAFGLPLPTQALKGSPNVYLIKGVKGRRYNERINTLENYAALTANHQATQDFSE